MFGNNFQGGMPQGYMMNQGCGCPQQPVVEPTINKCIERQFCHEVPQE